MSPGSGCLDSPVRGLKLPAFASSHPLLWAPHRLAFNTIVVLKLTSLELTKESQFTLPLDFYVMDKSLFLKLFFQYRFFFSCGPFLKSSWNLLQYCFCFTFWIFNCEVCGILTAQPGFEPSPPALKAEVVITGPPRKSLLLKLIFLRYYNTVLFIFFHISHILTPCFSDGAITVLIY